MSSSKSLIAIAVMALCNISAVAQNATSIMKSGGKELQWRPSYGFIQVQGGVGTTLTDVNCFKLLTPTLSVGGGVMFSSTVGARVHVNGWKSTGGFDNIVGLGNTVKKYKYNYINSNVDLLINILNIFSSNEYRPFDLYLIGGVGLNYAWHNDEFESLISQYQVGSDISNAWGSKQNIRHNLLGHSLRAGILADLNLTRHWSVGAEIDFNSLNDHFNSKYTNSDDWMITAQLSVTYKFGHTKKPEPPSLPITRDNVIDGTTDKDKNAGDSGKTPPVIPTVKKEAITESIFYALRESDLTDETIINKVAQWCKDNPQKTITIDGYADRGTGNPKLNEGYAKLRAEKVANALKEKGVPASQMTVRSFGDTVQPFPENDKNRCVIIEGK